ncbi:phosphodiesterase [Nonomuraea rhodomycinica]|uniref:Phosphodiesterase n=1 Tax=Nonomuraea rhodomycinica TaxID=1712872 RepID=A0A7Y6IUU2_9ACTN|nr:phosphodiesterase [Nonomuraea rhodomycinica]NUW44496.1 phosphodiesterase [Nonomuraea rhodomycinica]
MSSGSLSERAASVVARLVATLRRGRALHRDGLTVAATLVQERGPAPGLPALVEPGSYEVVARLSRGGSLPGPLPDVLGLALRLPGAGPSHGDVDLLLSTCVPGVPWLPGPRLDFTAGPYSSLAAYRHGSMPVRLFAYPEKHPEQDGGTGGVPARIGALRRALERGPLVFRLLAAPAGRRPVRVATLRVHTPLPGADVSFDPVLNGHPALRLTGWLARLRRGAYRGSRWGRGQTDEAVEPGRTTRAAG